MAIENNEESNLEQQILNNKSKDRDSKIVGQQSLWERSHDLLMLDTTRSDMKCAQHAAHNPAFEKMGLFRHPRWWP